MRTRLIGPGDTAWRDVVSTVPHDIYQLPAYADVSAGHEVGTAQAVLVEDGNRWLLLPVVIRTIDTSARDATSPYGYPGPVGSDTGDPGFLASALVEAGRALRDVGAISLFVRFHPILNPVLPVGVGTLVDQGETVTIDLDLPLEVIWQQTRENHRRHVKQALRAGHLATLEEGEEAFLVFQRLYSDTMARLGASPYHRFDRAYFDRLREGMGDRLWVAVVNIAGRTAAAGLFLREAGFVQYHLSGTDAQYAHHQPTKLMIHAVTRWAKERGDRWFHLGGGVGSAADSLLHFKAGFSPLRHRFVTLRMVLDEDEYRRRVRFHDPALDPGDASGYFPAYRAG